MSAPTSLFDKVWDAHVVRKIEDGPDVFLIIILNGGGTSFMLLAASLMR